MKLSLQRPCAFPLMQPCLAAMRISLGACWMCPHHICHKSQPTTIYKGEAVPHKPASLSQPIRLLQNHDGAQPGRKCQLTCRVKSEKCSLFQAPGFGVGCYAALSNFCTWLVLERVSLGEKKKLQTLFYFCKISESKTKAAYFHCFWLPSKCLEN